MSSTDEARRLLSAVRAELAPRDADNRLTPLVSRGVAPRSVFGRLAAEERHIVSSDWRSFHVLAGRSDHHEVRSWFAQLALGEEDAQARLGLLEQSCADAEILDDAAPRAGCQAYPAYVAWLALNGDPSEVALAVAANFAAWGEYCATIAAGMRDHYGFDDDACAFFDLFAEPPPSDRPVVAAVAAGLHAGRLDPLRAGRFAHLLQSYELMFWNTVAADDPSPSAVAQR